MQTPRVRTNITREMKLKICLDIMLEYLHEGCEDLRALDYSEVSVMNRKLVDFQQWLTKNIVAVEINFDKETQLIKGRASTAKNYQRNKLLNSKK